MKWISMLLLGVLTPAITAAAGPEQRIERAKLQLDEISKAVEAYFTDCSQFPLRMRDLYVPVAKCKQWGPEPYLNSSLNDPWGYPIEYKSPTWNTYILRSLGRDHREGGTGEDMDIVIEFK